MAFSSRNMAVALFFIITAGHAYAAELAEDDMYANIAGVDKNSFGCEELPVQHCAFAVSSSGRRCVLETNVKSDGAVDLECQTSKVVAEKFSSWIESDQCVDFCGLSRMYVGLSSDFLGEKDIQRSICASACIEGCPNIAELFTKLASGEGVGLKSLCEAHFGAPIVVAATEETTSATEEAAATETSTTTEEEPVKIQSISRKLIQSAIPASVTVTVPEKVTISVFPAADAPSASVYGQAAYFAIPAPAAAPSSSPIVVAAPVHSVSPAPATELIVVPAPASEAIVVPAPASESVVVPAPASESPKVAVQVAAAPASSEH